MIQIQLPFAIGTVLQHKEKKDIFIKIIGYDIRENGIMALYQSQYDGKFYDEELEPPVPVDVLTFIFVEAAEGNLVQYPLS